MFREIREIKSEERNLTNNKNGEQGYKQIKAQTNMTVKEVNNYWNNLFASLGEE